MGHHSHGRERLFTVSIVPEHRYLEGFINMRGVSFGYDQGVMSGLLSGQAFIKTFPEIDTTATGHGSSSLQGTV